MEDDDQTANHRDQRRHHHTRKPKSFWVWAITSIVFRLILVYFSKHLNLSSRPEVSTPVTSLRRLAEGYWLKQSSLSPYSGSMYHGSPLLLSVLGPLTFTRIEGQPSNILCSLLFVIADLSAAIFIRASGRILQSAYGQHLKSLGLDGKLKGSDKVSCGDIAALVYLWNPMTIVTCVGSSTAPIENFFIVLSIYGSCARLPPLAAFGWAMATHLSLYPAILVIPMILLLTYGPDGPPRKVLVPEFPSSSNRLSNTSSHKVDLTNHLALHSFSWKMAAQFLLWASIWLVYILVLCAFSVKQGGGFQEMLRSTYGFILTVEDLSPNVGVLWYFFAEVFDFFRNFFLIVLHMNILFMLVPLAVRLKHRPCFLAFIYIAISTMLKSYPSGLDCFSYSATASLLGLVSLALFVSLFLDDMQDIRAFKNCQFSMSYTTCLSGIIPFGKMIWIVFLVADSALYLALLGLFSNELAGMDWSFLIFCGYIGVNLLSPVMHNLWIWRGTGNANFYYATSAAYFILQALLVAGSVNSVLNHDRNLKDLSTAKD